jgi:hypothetical protein
MLRMFSRLLEDVVLELLEDVADAVEAEEAVAMVE